MRWHRRCWLFGSAYRFLHGGSAGPIEGVGGPCFFFFSETLVEGSSGPIEVAFDAVFGGGDGPMLGGGGEGPMVEDGGGDGPIMAVVCILRFLVGVGGGGCGPMAVVVVGIVVVAAAAGVLALVAVLIGHVADERVEVNVLK